MSIHGIQLSVATSHTRNRHTALFVGHQLIYCAPDTSDPGIDLSVVHCGMWRGRCHDLGRSDLLDFTQLPLLHSASHEHVATFSVSIVDWLAPGYDLYIQKAFSV